MRQKEGSSGHKEKEEVDKAAVARLTPRGLGDLDQPFPTAESSEPFGEGMLCLGTRGSRRAIPAASYS